MNTKLKVLEIGAGPKPQAHTIWEDADIETMDADKKYNPTHLHDAQTIPEELYEKYDALLASHVLEHFPHWQTFTVLSEWVKAVKVGTGSLHVVVPSFEWAAEQALSEHPSPATLPHLFGGIATPWDAHMTAFTMRHLRVLFEHAGLAVTRARTGPYPINAYGNVVQAEQHYICGVRKK
jgi:predicted SAM-dependent methyltransferase